MDYSIWQSKNVKLSTEKSGVLNCFLQMYIICSTDFLFSSIWGEIFNMFFASLKKNRFLKGDSRIYRMKHHISLEICKFLSEIIIAAYNKWWLSFVLIRHENLDKSLPTFLASKIWRVYRHLFPLLYMEKTVGQICFKDSRFGNN